MDLVLYVWECECVCIGCFLLYWTSVENERIFAKTKAIDKFSDFLFLLFVKYQQKQTKTQDESFDFLTNSFLSLSFYLRIFNTRDQRQRLSSTFLLWRNMSTIPHSLSPHCWRFVIIIGNVRSYTYTYPTYIHTYVYTDVCMCAWMFPVFLYAQIQYFLPSVKKNASVQFISVAVYVCFICFLRFGPLAFRVLRVCVSVCAFCLIFFLHYFLFPIHFSFVLYSSCWLSLIPHFLLSFHTALVLSAPLSSFEYLLSPLKSSTSGVVEIDVDVNVTEKKTRNAWGGNNCKSWINQKWKEKHSRQLKFTHLYLLPSQTYAVP